MEITTLLSTLLIIFILIISETSPAYLLAKPANTGADNSKTVNLRERARLDLHLLPLTFHEPCFTLPWGLVESEWSPFGSEFHLLSLHGFDLFFFSSFSRFLFFISFFFFSRKIIKVSFRPNNSTVALLFPRVLVGLCSCVAVRFRYHKLREWRDLRIDSGKI